MQGPGDALEVAAHVGKRRAGKADLLKFVLSLRKTLVDSAFGVICTYRFLSPNFRFLLCCLRLLSVNPFTFVSKHLFLDMGNQLWSQRSFDPGPPWIFIHLALQSS